MSLYRTIHKTDIMNVADLFGGKTRFAILEALVEAKRPMTAYNIAMAKGLDPAATYRYMTEFQEFKIVESETNDRNQTFYRLSDVSGKAAAEFLRSLKQATSEVIDLEKWISPEIRGERMRKIVRVNTNLFDNSTSRKPSKPNSIDEAMARRVRGELSALIESSQMAFNELFKENNGVFVLNA